MYNILLAIFKGLIVFYAAVGLLFFLTENSVSVVFKAQIALPYLYTIHNILLEFKEEQ
jgi:uncharacterized protein (DUF3084 family)